MSGPPAGFNPNISLLSAGPPDASITPAMGGGGMVGGATIDFLQKLIPKITSKEVAAVSYKNKGDTLAKPIPLLTKKIQPSIIPTVTPPVSRHVHFANKTNEILGSPNIDPKKKREIISSNPPVVATRPPAVIATSSSPDVVAKRSPPEPAVPVVVPTIPSPEPAVIAKSSPPEVPVVATSPPPVQEKPYEKDFFEKQEGAGCGRHAINNLFHYTYFTKGGADIPKETKIADLKPPLSLTSLCTYLSNKYPEEKIFVCKAYEDYDTPVLIAALGVLHHPSERINDTDVKQAENKSYNYNETSKNLLGYIINLGDTNDKEHKIMNHWVALRKDPSNPDQFLYVNSIGKDTGIYTSLTDYLTKRHATPYFRAIIKVLNYDPSFQIDTILGDIKKIKLEEKAKADILQRKKQEIEAIIDSWTTDIFKSSKEKAAFIGLCIAVEHVTILDRVEKLLKHPRIKEVVTAFKSQLLELNNKEYPALKTATLITLLTLILFDTKYTVDTYSIDPIDDLDQLYSFYYTGNEDQREIIYGFLLNDFERAKTKTKIEMSTEIQNKISRLMNGNILSDKTGSTYMFAEDKRTEAFLDAYLKIK
jgi:hypothetical protein